jgi:phosphoribosyl 1,2-cyclic phosphodiesterase
MVPHEGAPEPAGPELAGPEPAASEPVGEAGVRLWLLGVRGSTPAPGPDFVVVGGNTSCVAVALDDGPPVLVLDAGTGLRRLTALLDSQPFRGTIALTHLHWDHVQGLPFVAAIDRPDARVRLLQPDQPELGDARAVLGRALSPPHFPIGPEGLRGDWSFEGLDVGTHALEGLTVTARTVAHKGGRTFGYRLDDGPRSVAYLPDHALVDPALGSDGPDRLAAALDLARGVDLLIHDAQFTQDEQAVARAYGHATVEAAVALAERAQARRLVLFHHGPDRTDAQVAALAAAIDSAVAVEVGTENTLIELSR